MNHYAQAIMLYELQPEYLKQNFTSKILKTAALLVFTSTSQKYVHSLGLKKEEMISPPHLQYTNHQDAVPALSVEIRLTNSCRCPHPVTQLLNNHDSPPPPNERYPPTQSLKALSPYNWDSGTFYFYKSYLNNHILK